MTKKDHIISFQLRNLLTTNARIDNLIYDRIKRDISNICQPYFYSKNWTKWREHTKSLKLYRQSSLQWLPSEYQSTNYLTKLSNFYLKHFVCYSYYLLLYVVYIKEEKIEKCGKYIEKLEVNTLINLKLNHLFIFIQLSPSIIQQLCALCLNRNFYVLCYSFLCFFCLFAPFPSASRTETEFCT